MINRTKKLTATGLFAAMITIMTAYLCHIPYGVNGGYIHFGDALIYLGAIFLPKPYALAAAAIGGGMADLLTAPMWMPATVLIKMLIVLPFTSQKERILTPRNLAAPLAAGMISAAGYYAAEGVLFGSFAAPAASLAGSAVQASGSAIIFFLLAAAMDKSHIKNKVKNLLNFN